MYWIIGSNPKVFNHDKAFQTNGFIDWTSHNKFSVDDIIFIYVSKPVQAIKYVGIVEKINLDINDCANQNSFWIDINKYDNSKSGKFVRIKLLGVLNNNQFSLSELKNNGLSNYPQNTIKVDNSKAQLKLYLDCIFSFVSNNNQNQSIHIEIENLLSKPPLKKVTYTSIKKPAPPQLVDDSIKLFYKRDAIVAANALIIANFKCELDPNHPSFLRRSNKQNYTESHHLIPLSAQSNFNYSLDVEENIVSLCSNCHNLLHYGDDSQRKDEIKKLYNKRINLLNKVGLNLTIDKLYKYYGI